MLGSVSIALVGVSALFTVMALSNSGLYIFGMNSYFLSQGNYPYWFAQMFSSQFLHGGILHLLMNSVFVLYFGSLVEDHIGRKQYITFFIFTAIFVGAGLTLLGAQNTVGMSSFALGVLTFYTLSLWSIKHPEYKGGITAIVVNIAIGLSPGISFLGHFLGMIAGGLFWFLRKYF